ncbi:MAG: hypothetical protein NWE98_05365 [Candidatus Bathyarchaeota archaeon]|nr:hypothetical protein [Candidatus Bathyarchaeota archaeon]
MEIIDLLFNVLRNLNKKNIDWMQIESCLNQRREFNPFNLDFSKLSVAIQGHLALETSKETYNLLKTLYEHFSSLAKKNVMQQGICPDYRELKTIILTYYTLNDVILSMVIGDRSSQKEIDELLLMLEAMPKRNNSKLNVAAFRDAIAAIGKDTGVEDAVAKLRILFRALL